MSTADLKKLASISIHAPTRGATCDDVTALISGKISIHAPTRGATQPPNIANTTIRFQSTLPREERRMSNEFKSLDAVISIHAPTRGATQIPPPKYLFTTISIHAPTRGATSLCLNCGIKKEFQSTLPREERPTCCCKLSCSCHFNPRSHERSD